jgi:hypothetical protein
MSLCFVLKLDFHYGEISKYPTENECFFIFWKIKLEARGSKLAAYSVLLNAYMTIIITEIAAGCANLPLFTENKES